MFKGLRNIMLFLICLLFMGCGFYIWDVWSTKRRFVASHSSIKFPNDQKDIDNYININGYFCNYAPWVAEDIGKMFFYKDGSVLMTGNQHEKGLYKISNDTITANMYHFDGPIFNWWWLQIYYFKIIDRQHLKLIDKVTKFMLYDWGYVFTDSIYTFHETDSIPPPSTYMRKRKWMWHDERDWEQWMDEHGYKH